MRPQSASSLFRPRRSAPADGGAFSFALHGPAPPPTIRRDRHPAAWRRADAMNSEQAPAPTASLVPRLLVGLVRLSGRFPRPALALGLIPCAASVYAACAKLEYRTGRTDLESPN